TAVTPGGAHHIVAPTVVDALDAVITVTRDDAAHLVRSEAIPTTMISIMVPSMTPVAMTVVGLDDLPLGGSGGLGRFRGQKARRSSAGGEGRSRQDDGGNGSDDQGPRHGAFSLGSGSENDRWDGDCRSPFE